MEETSVVELNGNPYAIKLPITRKRIPSQTDAIRQTASFQRTNNPKLEPFVFNDWHRGFGHRFVRPGHPEDKEGFYDANVNTLWPQSIVLPMVATGIADAAGMIFCSVPFGANLLTVWTPIQNDATTDTIRAVLTNTGNFSTGTTSTIHTEVAADAGVQAYDIILADKLYCIFSSDQHHLLRYSADGATWTAPATTAPPTGLLGGAGADANLDIIDGARLAYDGTNVVLALRDIDAGEVEVWKSTNSGDTWTVVVTFASDTGPTGMVAYLDTDDTTVIYLATRDALWLVDIGTATAERILPLNGNTYSGMRMVVHNGSLYIPIDNGNDSPFGMKKMTVVGGNRVYEDVGLDITQGIPSDMLGNVRWMRSYGPFLFISVGGAAASRNAHILAITGQPGDGWQNVLKFVSTNHANLGANDLCPWFDFDGNDLYFQAGGAITSDSGDTMRLTNLMSPPDSGATFIYAAIGDLELPEVGGDAPEEDKAFLQVQGHARDLVDGAEVLDVEYGINGAAATTAGATIDASNPRAALGTSSRGVSGRTMRPNIEFNRGGTSTLTPKLLDFVLLYRTKTTRIESFEFEIDLVETANYNKRPYEQVVTDIETVMDSATLVAFKEYGKATEKQVEVAPDYEFLDWIRSSPGSEQYGGREGRVRIRLEEVL